MPKRRHGPGHVRNTQGATVVLAMILLDMGLFWKKYRFGWFKLIHKNRFWMYVPDLCANGSDSDGCLSFFSILIILKCFTHLCTLPFRSLGLVQFKKKKKFYSARTQIVNWSEVTVKDIYNDTNYKIEPAR